MDEEGWLPNWYEDKLLFPWSTFLHREIYDENCKCAVKGKVELYTKIHANDIVISKMYVTMTGQVVAWVKSTSNRVQEIIRWAAQIKNEFQNKDMLPKNGSKP